MVYAPSEDSFLNDTAKLPVVPTIDVVVQPSASDFTDRVALPCPAALASYGTAHGTSNMLPSPVPDVEMAPLRRSRRRGTGGNSSIRARLLEEWENVQARWRKFGKSSTLLPVTINDTEPSALLQHSSSQPIDDTLDEVDEVIVDNLALGSGSPSHSDYAAEATKQPSDDAVDKELHEERTRRNLSILAPYYIFRRTVWHGLHRFYATSFAEKDLERHYRQETWRISKGLGATSTLFLLINWVLCVALWPRPFNLSDRIFLYAITPIFTFPPALIIWFDFPTKRPILYQSLIGVAIWSWAMYQVFYLTACGNYTNEYALWDSGCSGRDFLGLFYWACALPTIGLFGLKMTRLTATIGALAFVTITSVVIVPFRHTWIRNVVNFAAFNLFLLWIHYAMEQSERRLYILQDRLIVQNKQTQEAQKNERAVADSKRRLTSYVFHEVRVPLNTAVLAVQNVQAGLGAAAQSHKVEFTALTGSLKQMSAVLNDILDFNRMESGKFAFVAHPFAFHTTMRSLFGPLKLSAEARKLSFVTDLDSNIDHVAIKTSSETIQGTEQNVGVFIGDEQRLRQVVTNLASNACKFTPAGGEVKLTTQLLGAPSSSTRDHRTSDDDSFQHLRGINHITVRIEVSDTGCGIRRQDMVESKLFSSFSQTEQGRLQGGKGTGLGLAIVRQIVQLAGGRLRVRSRVGFGTSFTVDMPLRLMAKDVRPPTPALLSQQPSSPPTRPPVSPTYPSPPNSQGTIPQAGPASLAKALSDPILSPPVLHGSQSSALMSLARVQPVQPQDTPEEEAFAAHAAAGLPHPSLTSPSQISPPASASTSRIPSESEAVPPPSPGFPAGLRALVVDDDNMTRMLMKRMLTRLGCTVQAAENGQVALDAVLAPPMAIDMPMPTPSSDSHRSSYGLYGPVPAPSPASSPGHPMLLPHGDLRYAVVFLDNQMPVMSGLDMVRAVRREGVNLFVVGVTGNALLQDQQEFIEAGADHVLTKPVYERDLKRMLVLADEHRLKALAQGNGY